MVPLVNLECRVRRVGYHLPYGTFGYHPDTFHANAREPDARIWNEWILPSPKGRLVPLPPCLIAFIRELGVQNILPGTAYGAAHTERLLDYVLQVDWQKTPGYP